MLFIFPQNYNFHARLLGFFDYTTLFFNILWLGFLFAVSNLLFQNLDIKVFFCISLYIPAFLLSFIGLSGENIFSFIVSIYGFIKNRRIYYYSK